MENWVASLYQQSKEKGWGCGSIKWHMDWKLAPTPQSFSFQAEQVHPWEKLSCSLHGTLDSAGTCCGSLPAGPSPLAPWLCKDPNPGHSPWLVERNIPCFPEQSCAGWSITPAHGWWEMTRCERGGKCSVITGETCLVLVLIGTQSQCCQFPGNSRDTKQEES